MTQATAALDQSMTIEHGMDGAFGGDGDIGESAEQTLADLVCAPANVLTLHVQNIVFYLEGKLVGVAKGTPASIGQSLPRIPGSEGRFCSRSCGRCQTPGKVPPSTHRLAGEPQTAVSHP